ncbi:hypothetical protein HPP92_013629 [Vanilla planifolia]|uniref:Cystatin domain-containing protein n=1 Tax=Vanilla planifolia TaxID=51239 RepID=A0A835QS29_VANPL|nr:hypothetical protein HPP92_013629 [Vanilla planifolia]
MASYSPPTVNRRTSRSSTPFFSLLLATSLLVTGAKCYEIGWGRKVGGWAEIPNAGSNAEVRELARYSVEVYNREIRATGESSIDFVRVVSARRQVVSGIKYQIGVAASEVDTGKIRFFDAVIVVRPWLRKFERQLLSFTPSAFWSS